MMFETVAFIKKFKSEMVMFEIGAVLEVKMIGGEKMMFETEAVLKKFESERVVLEIGAALAKIDTKMIGGEKMMFEISRRCRSRRR